MFVNLSLTLASAFLLLKDPQRNRLAEQVNESFSPLQPLKIAILRGKIPNGTPSPPPAPQLFRLCASVNS